MLHHAEPEDRSICDLANTNTCATDYEPNLSSNSSQSHHGNIRQEIPSIQDVLANLSEKPVVEPLNKVEEKFLASALRRKEYQSKQVGILKVKTRGQPLVYQRRNQVLPNLHLSDCGHVS